MPVAIRNLSSTPVFIPLNSGTNLRLSPGEVADQIPDVELQGNSKIEKLLSQRTIAVEKPTGSEKSTKSEKRAESEEKSAVVTTPEAEGDDDSEKPRTRERRGTR